METRANHVLIGGFVLLVLLAGFLFVMWLGRLSLDREFEIYDIVFDGSVTGLSIAGDVRYNGIKVGEVRDLSLKADDPSKVITRIQVDATAPISEDTVATLEFMGVTGVSYILLSGGEPDSEKLKRKQGEPYPVIASQTSGLQDLFSGAPTLIARANEFIERLNLLLDDENRQSITAMLDNVETISAAFAGSSNRYASLVGNLDEAAANISRLTNDLQSVIGNVDQIVDQDVRRLIARAADTAETASRVATELEITVAQNRESISDFTRSGLGEVTRFAQEARQLVRTLDRLASRLESDPAALVYGSDAPEVDLQ